MANTNRHWADLGGNRDGDINDWSISKLIFSLKSAFCTKDYARVEAVLVAREEKNKREMEKLTEEKGMFSDKFEEQKLEMMKYKKECEESRLEIPKLEKEISILREKCKNSEESYEKLMVGLKRNGDKEKETIDLKDEYGKLKYEFESCKQREKSLKERCNNLAEELKEKKKDLVDIKNKNLELEGDRDKAMHEKVILMKSLDQLHERVSSLESGFQLLENEKDLNEKGIGGENTNSQDMDVKCDEILKVEKVFFGSSCDSHDKSNENSENAGSGRHPTRNTIEILDSDDDCTLVETPCKKETTSGQSEQIDAENGSETLKRKCSSGMNVDDCENGDDDNNLPSRSLKMKKCEEPMSKNERPLNHCPTTTISSGVVEVNEGFTTTVDDVTASRESEKQMKFEQKDGFSLKGLPLIEESSSFSSSSSSSSSDSDSDDYNLDDLLNYSKFAPVVQWENQK